VPPASLRSKPLAKLSKLLIKKNALAYHFQFNSFNNQKSMPEVLYPKFKGEHPIDVLVFLERLAQRHGMEPQDHILWKRDTNEIFVSKKLLARDRFRSIG
jgi:hypothetical protein